MARIVLIASRSRSLINFRGDLIKALVKKNHEVITLAPETGVEKEIESLGAQFIKIPLQRTGMNPLYDLYGFFSLIKTIKLLKPDIVLSYTIKPVIYGSLAAELAGTQNINSIITGVGSIFYENNDNQKLMKKVLSALYKKALSKNKVIFFQNPDNLNEFKKMNLITNNKIQIIDGSGVNIDKYYYVEPKTDSISFLLIARLLKDKGIREYVNAARKLKASYPDVSFKLLGPLDTNPTAIKSDEIEAWVKEGIIEYLGETRDVRPFIAEITVYVLPSYHEGTPRTVLEAMSMGRPVITTDAPGCRETVTHEVNGYLVPIKDSNALAEAMERFILNPELVSEMGAKSREIAEEKYDVHKVNKEIMKTMGLG